MLKKNVFVLFFFEILISLKEKQLNNWNICQKYAMQSI